MHKAPNVFHMLMKLAFVNQKAKMRSQWKAGIKHNLLEGSTRHSTNRNGLTVHAIHYVRLVVIHQTAPGPVVGCCGGCIKKLSTEPFAAAVCEVVHAETNQISV